jgi:cytochrome c biogenesis protein CcmG/thiol:disulfide interchange protein DsbE
MAPPSNDNDNGGLWTDDSVEEKPTPPRLRGLIMLVPLIIFIALAIMFAFALRSGDPSKVPSALISKPAPDIALGPVPGIRREGAQVPGFSRADLMDGKVSVVNIWASWCGPCRLEHEFLVELRDLRPGANLFGINYKDSPDAARRFLRQLGNPFDAVGEDRRGRAGVEWGVTGVPETFVVDGDGTIIYKLVGPITADNLREELLPAIDGADPSAREAAAARGEPGRL